MSELVDERDGSRLDEELRDVFGRAAGITSRGRVGQAGPRAAQQGKRAPNGSSFEALQTVAQDWRTLSFIVKSRSSW